MIVAKWHVRRTSGAPKALVVALSFCRLLGLGCPKQAFAKIATPRNLKGQIFADYVRGQLDTGGNVPRLPPLRYGMQLDYTGYKDFAAGLRLTRAEKQTQVGDNETSTKGYLLLDANISYNWQFSKNSNALFFVKGNNLLNETIRNSTSFLKDHAPEPGRGAELGVKITF